MRIHGNRFVALMLSAGMVTTFLAACSIDPDQLGKGINELGNAFTTETQTETTEAPKETTEITTPSVSEEITETTAEATTTPTPSPTPLPQRVDFSDHTDINLNDTFKVTTETFGESAYVEGTDVLLAKFEGTRFVVTSAANETVKDSINVIVDSFYKEAAAAYTRMYSKAQAEYQLTGVVENTYSIVCDFQYTTNGRVLSVLMVYDVSGVEADKTTVIDFASFDMISGQYITLNSICKDPSGLENALKAGLANSLKIQPKPSTTETTGTGETAATTAETTVAAKTPEAEDFTALYIAPGPATTEPANNNFATIYGVTDGKIYSAVIDMNAYKDFLNRYGASIFFA